MTWRFSALVNICLYPIVAVISLLGAVSSAQAAGYIKFDGIEGESRDKGHGGWSDILSFSQPVYRAGKGRGVLVPGDMVVEMVIDSASDEVIESIMNGGRIGRVMVELCEGRPSTDCDPDRRNEQHCYIKYEFTDLLVSSYETGGSDGYQRGSVAMTFEYKDFEQVYTPAPQNCPTAP